MKKLIFIAFVLGCAVAWSQQGSVPAMVVVCRGILTSDVDSAIAEAGQEVHIKLRDGCKAPEFQLEKNTELVVVVAEAAHAAKSQPSMLRLVFDRAVPEKGDVLPVIGIVQ